MKVGLIYPATEFDIIHHKDSLANGLLYIAAMLEREKQDEVMLFDARHGEAMPADPKEFDIIGFTAMSMQIEHAFRMMETIRGQGFTGKIVIGGPHASVTSDHLTQNTMVDAVFIGESDKSFFYYLRYLEGINPEPPDNVLIRTTTHPPFAQAEGDGKFVLGTSPVGFVDSLDLLPFPARHHFGHVIRKTKFINIFTCRGCPFNCEFCQPTKRILFGNRVRARSVTNIYAEIVESIDLYGINGFSIDDDTFTYNQKRIFDFCDLVKERKLFWSCQSRSDISRETLIAMRDSGCWLIFVGAESGSQRVLQLMGKKNSVENNIRFIQTCNELGIKTWCNIILGYPGETLEDLEMTYRFVVDSQPTRACVSQATPFPGTHLYNKYRDELLPFDWDRLARHIPYPRFKSMVYMQKAISEYQQKCSIGWDKPLVP